MLLFGEYDRSLRGTLARRGGHPDARDLAASSFRLIGFQIGSGIATLTPARPLESDDANLPLDDSGEDLSLSTIVGLLSASLQMQGFRSQSSKPWTAHGVLSGRTVASESTSPAQRSAVRE